MRAEWWGAIFGAAIFIRMVLCAVCMRRGSDHFVRVAMLGVLAAGLGLMVAPFYSALEIPVDLLLAGSTAAYLYADRRSIGACGMACPYDVVVVLDWLDRWRRPLATALIGGAVVAMVTVAQARTDMAPGRGLVPGGAAPTDLVTVNLVQLEQLIDYANQLVDEVQLLRWLVGKGCT